MRQPIVYIGPPAARPPRLSVGPPQPSRRHHIAGTICIECRSAVCSHLTVSATLAPHLVPVVRMVGAFAQNKEIAIQCGLTEGTVKGYLNQIYQCMGYYGAGSRMRLGRWAQDNAELLAPKAA